MMRPDPVRTARKRLNPIERLEDRLAMAAEVVYDFWTDDVATTAQSLDTLAVTTPYANAQTGVNSVRNDYGFLGGNQTVAVIDTGIAWDHYALGRGYGDGYRVVGGWDFAEGDADPYDDGPAGFHGTHVAGIIGSNNNKYSGVATDVDLVALRVFNDQGAGKFEWVEQALRWVHEHRFEFENPITTVNLSLGAKWNASTLPNWAILEDELKQLYDDGIFVSVAAGNDFASYNSTGLSYPAVSQYVVAVGSVTSTGIFSSFSQRADRILAAPGQSITSSVPDWLYGGNGIANDYGAASGTSMAAPFVAGAAVLVREAMQFVGQTNITQDAIYNQLRNTADVFFDTATNANYFRINVGRAIDSLMPVDDFGDSLATAQQLGTRSNDWELHGLIGKKSDVDSFTFTAGVSGKVALDANDAEYLRSDVTIVGATSSLVDGKLTFSITTGQQYTLQVGTKAGIGHYSIALEVTAAQPEIVPTDWGTVAVASFSNQRLAGEAWYQFTATRSGLLTLETLLQSGQVRVELLDNQRQVLAHAGDTTDYARLDIQVQTGGTYFVRVIGNANAAEFRLTNLVTQLGNSVQVFGTAGNDVFSFTAGTEHQLAIHGVTYRFAASAVTNISFDGQGGNDSALLVGTSQNETASFSPESAALIGGTYRVTVSGVRNVMLDGQSGNDRIEITGSVGDDLLTIARNDVSMVGGGWQLRGLNFSVVTAFASSGNDEARLHDTAGNDRFSASATQASLQGSGYLHSVRGFDRVIATASGGDDVAYLYDTAGDDQFVGKPQDSSLSVLGYFNQAHGFDRVFATATLGNDTAELYDSAGHDRFYGQATASWLTGQGSYNRASGFDQVIAYATSGGVDLAYLYDSLGDDQFVADPRQALLRGTHFANAATGFSRVFAFASQGHDSAQLLDSAGNDRYVSNASSSYLTGNGYYNSASGFRNVSAQATTGDDQAFFNDLGQGDRLQAAQDSTAITRAKLTELIVGFEFVTAKATSRGVQAEVQAVDYLFTREGTWE